MTARRRAVARRPKPRTVEVTGEGEYEGWWCLAKADFPARLLEPMESGQLMPIMDALEAIILEHNFPGIDGELAPHLADVDPWKGVEYMAGRVTDAIKNLPPR